MLAVMRVEYDVEKAAENMKRAGLPEYIAERLKKGI